MCGVWRILLVFNSFLNWILSIQRDVKAVHMITFGMP